MEKTNKRSVYNNKKIIKTKLIIYDESPLMKKLVYDVLSNDAGIQILNIFKEFKDIKTFVSNNNNLIDGVIVNLSKDHENIKDLISLLLEVKNYTDHLILVTNMSTHNIFSFKQILGLDKLIIIDYDGKLDLKDIFHIKEKIIAEVYRIKNSRIKHALLDVQKAVVIAASTGGPKTLEYMFEKLKTKIDIPIFIVQHMPDGCTRQFAERLSQVSIYSICEGKHGELIKSNIVYIAPSGYHMEIDKTKSICITTNNPVNNVRPSADVLFCSASRVYGKGLLGIVLTGMGKDASDGVRFIKLNGGSTIAQCERSSVVFGMPKAAIETGMVDKVLSTDEILVEILKHADKL